MMPRYVARPYIAGTPQAEVLGLAVLAFAENLEAELTRPLLPRYGFDAINPNAWYSHQAWMDLLKEMETTLGASADSAFIAFGMKVVETAAMPPEIASVPDALNALHTIHHLNLRHIPPDEGYVTQKLGEKIYHVYENTPNPYSVIYGFLWGMVNRYRPAGSAFSVRKLENPHPDEIAGVLFEITWT